MSISKIKLGTLYMDNTPVLFNTTTPISYINNSTLELKASISDVNYQIEWLVIEDGAKYFLLSTKNIMSNISYNTLATQALINGSTIVTLTGVKYKVRLITNEEWNKYVLNQINLNNLQTPSLLDMTVNGYDDTTISSSDTNNLLHWYKAPSLTQTIDSNTNDIIIRGGNSIDSSSLVNKDALCNYRIVLEKYNTPPTISGIDGTLGTFSANFSKNFSVTDPDNDLFTIITKVDDTIIQTLPNQVSKTDFSINLENQWNSLLAGRHELTVNVTDSYGNFVQRKWIFNKLDSDVGTSNALVRPQINTNTSSLSSLLPIDGNTNNTFTFSATGGELVIAHEFSIVDNSTQIEVYKRKIESFTFEHVVPANTMINGNVYQLKVRTYNQSGLYSNWSDIVIVRALTPVELMINTIINERIETGNPYFTASATFVNTEGDGIYSYEYNLYNDGVVIATSNELTDGKLAYQFTNLENKTYYTIELIVKTNFGMIVTLSQEFYCMYLQARLPAIMELKNDKKTGSIVIDTYVRQIIGRIYSGDDVYYIDNDWAYLHNTVLIYDKDGAFRLNGNWTAKIWARDLENNDTMLLNFNLDDGSSITLTRNNNMFTLSKIVNGIKLYELHSFIQGEILSTDVFYFFIQNSYDLGLMNFDVKRVTNGRLSWFTKTYDEDTEPTYKSEDGFLTNINSKLLELIEEKVIDGQSSKVYLPSVDDFNLDVFKPILPNEDSEHDYNLLKSDIVFGKVGTALVGDCKVFSDSYLPFARVGFSELGGTIVYNPTLKNIFTRNLYSGHNSLRIKYKIHKSNVGETDIYEKIDNKIINIRYNVEDDIDYIIDLSSIWAELSYGTHTLTIEATNYMYPTTKILTFYKAYDLYSIDINTNNKTAIITRTVDSIDSNKLIGIDEDGNITSIYPVETIGIRVMFDLPLDTKVSLYKDKTDNCYNLVTQSNTIFNTKTIDILEVGDKVKDFTTKYNNKVLRFTIVDKLDDRIILMCDNAICQKNFDETENIFINGNPNWNLSNIRQWLNNNIKIG